MKILHVSGNQFPSLTSDHHTKRIWIELAKGIEEYHILARSKDNSFHFYKEGNIYLHLVPALTKRQWSFFFTSSYMIKLLLKHNIRKILVQCPIMGGFTTAVISKFSSVKFMVEIHGEEYFRYFTNTTFTYRILNLIQRFTFNQASIIRSLSSKMTEKLNYYGIVRNIQLIPNRVDLALFNKKKQDFLIRDKPTLVSVGRFVEAKNYEFLVKFCLDNNYRLVLIGGGKLRQNYESIISSYHNSDDIILVDWVTQTDMIDMIIKADIYIQSSVTEGVPRAILEAMALNIPVVSTRVGSIDGVLDSGRNGYLINDPKNAEEYRNVLNELCQNIEVRKQIADAAFSDIVNHFEWNKVFDTYRYALKSL